MIYFYLMLPLFLCVLYIVHNINTVVHTNNTVVLTWENMLKVFLPIDVQ